jgi:mono/diheme cytochrome c family protein
MGRSTARVLLALAAVGGAALHLAYPAVARSHQVQKTPVLSAQAKRGLALAEARCAACHGLTADASSPNPEAPPFEAVANQNGLTRATLSRFLRNSHNFPVAMNFAIARSDGDALAAYMLTLQGPGYRPGI